MFARSRDRNMAGLVYPQVRALTNCRSDLRQRRPAEQQSLLTHIGEADDRLRLVARPDEIEDDAVAEGAVADVVADLEAERLGTRATGAGRPERGLDHALAVGVDAVAPVVAAAAPPSAPAVRAAAPARPALLDRLHQLGRDLVEEAARRVVLRAAVERAAPRVREVEALLGAGDR